MKLIIKILAGKRKGEKIFLSEVNDPNLDFDRLDYVLETEAFELIFLCDRKWSEVVLMMDNADYFFHEEGELNGVYTYVLRPKIKYNNYYEALFYNYFGVASMGVKVSCELGEDIFMFHPIEVLAKKLTANQAEYMVEYILNESKGDLSSFFSATKFGSKYIDGGEKPKKAIEKLLESVSRLEKVLPHILNNPLTRVSSEIFIQNGHQALEIDEQGLSWLSENLSVLDETDDDDVAHFKYGDNYYVAKEIQAAVTVEYADIYENRVVYDFLLKLKRFCNDLENGLKENLNEKFVGNRGPEGYVSFFSAVRLKLSEVDSVDISIITKLNIRITHLISFFDKKLSVSVASYGLPLFTQKVKGNRYYVSVFRTVVEWHRYNKVDWRSRDILMAIKSIPVLFEYYCVLKFKSELKLLCDVDDGLSEGENIFSGLYRGENISLIYEPEYWMIGHENSQGARYLNTEIRTFRQSSAKGGFKPSNHKYRKRMPDIVIELGNDVLFIFDAKYSNMKTAYSEYLHECSMKYIHGIHGVDGASPVKSMILICPAEDEILADMHASPYGLFDAKTVFPVIGVQSVTLSNNFFGDDKLSLGKTIKKLLNYAVDCK